MAAHCRAAERCRALRSGRVAPLHPGARLVERDAARGEDVRGHALALAQQPEDEVLAADLAPAKLDGVAHRELERLLRARGERDVPADAAPAAAQRARPERALDALAHRVEVDAERGERVGVDVLLAGADDAHDVVAHACGLDAEAGEQARARSIPAQNAEQDVLGADPAVAQRPGLVLRDRHGRARVLGEALEHQPSNLLRRPCLRWTACFDTPSATPISCHDHPRSRALATCSASRRSTSARSEATAASPTCGSVLSTAPARSRVSCAAMASTYVDERRLSTH